MEKNHAKVTDLVETALFAAIVILLAYTPIGYIPLGPISATTVHIPVILAGVVLGARKGAITGFIFGLTSFLNASFLKPNITSFLFSPFYPGGNFFSLVICFVPRILIGVVACLVFKAVLKAFKNQTAALIAAGISGSMTNTILVMGMAYIFFAEKYAAALEKPVEAVLTYILGVVAVNGVGEAVCASVLTTAIGSVLILVNRRRSTVTQ